MGSILGMITATVLLSEVGLGEGSRLSVETTAPVTGLELFLVNSVDFGGPNEGLVHSPITAVTALRAALVVLVTWGHRVVLGLCNDCYQYHSVDYSE